MRYRRRTNRSNRRRKSSRKRSFVSRINKSRQRL
jgi:hypothetical protein